MTPWQVIGSRIQQASSFTREGIAKEPPTLKRCGGCRQVLPRTLEYFYPHKDRPNKFQSLCKVCSNHYRNADQVERRAIWKREGKCLFCGQEQRPGRSLCTACVTTHIANAQKRKAARLAAGKCTNCATGSPAEGKRLCEVCLTKKRAVGEKRSYKTARQYGLTVEELHTMEDAQAGKCAICQEPYGGALGRYNIDHCHTTGRVRGLLCHKCNRGLGLFNDNTTKLQAAILYLEKFIC